MKAWQNWTGDETCAPEFTMPRSVDDVVAAVRRSAGAGRNVRLVGAGHSFGDVVCTDGTLMTLDGLRGLLDVDTAAGQVRVAAGTRLNELNRLLDEHGLALANLGDIDAQSVAGAIANGTHGTGRMLGNLAILVRSLRVWFRHAKAGELCERVDVLHLVENESIVATVPTYRGERRAIL